METFSLINPKIAMSGAHVSVELSSPTLRIIYAEDKFILKADYLEDLYLQDCAMELFELIKKGNVKHYKTDDVTHVSVMHLDIGEIAENLEVVDVSKCTIMAGVLPYDL